MLTRIMSVIVLPLILIISIGGCGQKDFPSASVKRAEGFSLGSAKIEPLKNPTAEQLQSAVIKFYDSLQSASVSYTLERHSTDEWSMDNKGNVTIEKEALSVPEYDFVFCKPGKTLIKVEDENLVRKVQNGTDMLVVSVPGKAYTKYNVDARLAEHVIPLWLAVTPDTITDQNVLMPREVTSLKMLPDDKLDGVDVYVLELSLKIGGYGASGLPAEIRRIYIGKKDLLLRQMSIIQPPSLSTRKNDHGDLIVLKFIGFQCNVDVPKDAFPMTAPAVCKKITVSNKPKVVNPYAHPKPRSKRQGAKKNY